jgi:hypothetical protein
VYEGLSRVLGQPPEELERWMELLIAEWKRQAGGMLARYGYDAGWLDA